MIRILCLVLLVIASSVYCEDHNVSIGFSYTTSFAPQYDYLGTEGQINILKKMEQIKFGLDVFKLYLDKNGGKIELNNDDTVTFNFDIRTDDYTSTSITNNYQNMKSDGLKYFISSWGSRPAEAASTATENDAILISTTSTSPFFHVSKEKSFSVFPNSLSEMKSISPLYFLSKIHNVTFIVSESDSALSCPGFADEFAKFNISNVTTVTYSSFDESEQTLKSYVEVAQKIIDQNYALLVFCGNDGRVLVEILKEFKRRNYTPMAGHSTTSNFNFTGNDDLIHYWTFATPIPSEKILPFGFPAGSFIKNYEEYLSYLEEAHPELFPNGTLNVTEEDYKLGSYGTIACEAILNAIINLESVDVDIVSDAIRRGIFSSFVGEISFDAQNQILLPGVSYQIINDSVLNILGPHGVSNDSLVFPMPVWKERKMRNTYHNIEIAVLVFLILALINSLIWLIVIIAIRDRKEVVASSPIFLVSMLIGSIFIFISLFFWMPNHMSNAGCSIHVGFLLFGFMLLFGSMVVKTWRVHLLFSQKTLEVFRISNSQVALFLAILLSIDIVLYLVWSLLTKPSISINYNPLDEYKPYNHYYLCSTTTGGTVLVWVMVGYHGLLFLYGAYLALRVRTIPFKIYDESKIIAFCIYNVGLVAIIVAILEGTSAAERYAQFGLRSFLIILSTVITINTMFIGKLTLSTKRVSSTSNNTSSDNSKMKSTIDYRAKSTTNYEMDLQKMRKQKKQLKKEVQKLREALDSLKQQ